MLYVVMKLNSDDWTVNGPFRERATGESAVIAALASRQCLSVKLVTVAGLRVMASKVPGYSLVKEIDLLGLSMTVVKRTAPPPPAAQPHTD